MIAIVSCFLPWLDPPGGRSVDSFDVPFKTLWDPFNAGNGLKLGVPLVILAAAAVLLSLFRPAAPLRRLTGIAVIVLAGLYFVQLGRLVDRQVGLSFGDVFDSTRPGSQSHKRATARGRLSPHRASASAVDSLRRLRRPPPEPQAPAVAPAGWYPNPEGPGRRYWDGSRWTEHYAN